MKLKLLISTIFSFFLGLNIYCQIELPEDKVHWKFEIDQKENEAYVIGNISTEEHWHINAINLPPDNFGYPSSFELIESDDYKLIGKVREPKPITKFDEKAKENLVYHEGTFKFKQKIKILSKENFELKGSFSFQTCNETKCLRPHTVDFTLQVKGLKNFEFKNNEKQSKEKVSEILKDNIDQYSKKNDSTTKTTLNNEKTNLESKKSNAGKKSKIGNIKNKVEKKNKKTDQSLWGIFIISFLSGFAALLTPCVFPMIPMTVSFFTKQSKTKAKGIKNAIIFGISIIVIYELLGTITVAIFGPEVLNQMSTNPWFNIVFFILLVIFAISFLGAFEIRMPSKWVNKVDEKADKGGLIGIFFMALALALVSFSCTGPIVGTLIVESAVKGGIAPIIGMFGFSLALALPFALFAAFPGWMNSLPKSGGWLNSVKVVLGFLELALAFKFLSNADLAWQTHFLEREVFISIWIAVFGVMTLYLFGKIRLPHDSPIEKLSVGRTMLGMTTFAFVVYLVPGLWGGSLKLINAFPPPKHYSENSSFFTGSNHNTQASNHSSDQHVGAQNLMLFNDYDKALAYAKQVNKPLLLDFTGWNCVNCRKMEETVWGESGVIDILRDSVVIVSLYVDERIDLPKKEQVEVEVTPGNFKVQKTVGDKWAYKQIREYNVSSQPYYIMQSPDGKDLSNGSADYENHSNPSDFLEWLQKGVREK